MKTKTTLATILIEVRKTDKNGGRPVRITASYENENGYFSQIGSIETKSNTAYWAGKERAAEESFKNLIRSIEDKNTDRSSIGLEKIEMPSQAVVIYTANTKDTPQSWKIDLQELVNKHRQEQGL